jgi:hypothetical protein
MGFSVCGKNSQKVTSNAISHHILSLSRRKENFSPLGFRFSPGNEKSRTPRRKKLFLGEPRGTGKDKNGKKIN